jgi:hypothetical protein
MSDPSRPPGRPRHYADEPKEHPVAFRTTFSLKYALLQACKASARSLTREIEYRLWRSFEGSDTLAAENHLGILLDGALKDFEQRLIDLLAIVGSARKDLADPQNGERETAGQRRPVMYSERDPARLLPVEIGVTRGDDGRVSLVLRQGEWVIREIPLEIGAARQLADELGARTRGSDQTEEPTSARRNRRR